MLAMDFPSCPKPIEDSINGKIMEVSPRRIKLAPDRKALGLTPTVNIGSKETTTKITGIAKNLAISLRLNRDLSSLEAIADSIGFNHGRDPPWGT